MKVNERAPRPDHWHWRVAAHLLAVTIAIAPRAQTNQASGERHGIDVTSLGKNARNLPGEQIFPVTSRLGAQEVANTIARLFAGDRVAGSDQAVKRWFDVTPQSRPPPSYLADR